MPVAGAAICSPADANYFSHKPESLRNSRKPPSCEGLVASKTTNYFTINTTKAILKTINVRYSDDDKDGTQTHITLESGQVASTTEARGLVIECVRGSLWITFEEGGADHVLEPGERIPVKGGGRTVIEAMAASERVFYRQEPTAEAAFSHARQEAACSPECWRTFVAGVALPRANFDSGF